MLNYYKTGYILSDIGPGYVGGDVVIPSTYRGLPVVELEMYAFAGCKNNLTSVTIPSSVKKIGFKAFANCNSLETITIPASIEIIGECCFGGSGFTDIYFEVDAPREAWDKNWDEGLYADEEIGRDEDVNLHWTTANS